MKIKTKLQIILISLIAISGFLAALFYSAFERINDANDRAALADTIARNIIEQRIVSDEYLLHREARALRQWQLKQVEIDALLTEAEMLQQEDIQELITTLAREQGDVSEIFGNIVEEGATNENETQTSLSQDLEKRYIGQLLIKSQTMVTAAFRLAEAARNEIVVLQRFVSGIAVLSAVILLVSVFSVLILFQRSVVLPLGKLEEGTVRLAKGDLSHRIAIQNKDELGSLAASFNDMTEKLKASIAILEEERKSISLERNKLALVLSGIQDAVFAVDEERKILLLNTAAERILDTSSDRVLGKRISDVFRLYEDKKEILPEEYCGKTNTTGSVSEVFQRQKIRLVTASGEERMADIMSGSITGGKELGVQRIITLHDLSKELIAEQAKQKFITIAAHQLRTPLSGVRWALEEATLGSFGKLNKKQLDILVKSRQTVKNLISIVNDVLDVSHIENHQFTYQCTKQDFKIFLRELLDETEMEARERSLTLNTSIAEDIPEVLFDKKKLIVAFTNVLENSVHYTQSGGSITVRAHRKDNTVVTEIADTGIGIPPEDMGKIFTEFYRGSNAAIYETSGTGLGLFLAKTIIDAHKGFITLSSELGKGTVATITLPITTPA